MIILVTMQVIQGWVCQVSVTKETYIKSGFDEKTAKRKQIYFQTSRANISLNKTQRSKTKSIKLWSIIKRLGMKCHDQKSPKQRRTLIARTYRVNKARLIIALCLYTAFNNTESAV